MRVKFSGLLFLLCLPLASYAQSVSPSFILKGDKDGKYFGGDEYCETFYVEEQNGRWIPTERTDLSDKRIDRLRGCIALSSSSSINSLFIEVDANSSCKMVEKCAQYYDDVRKQGICVRPFSEPKLGTTRKDGYFLCTSNFAKLNIFGGGFSEERPIDVEKLRAALQSPEMAAKAAKILESRFTFQYERAGRLPSCGNCAPELRAARFIFDTFYAQAGNERLMALAGKYVRFDASMELPEWIGKRLTSTEVSSLKTEAEAYWKQQHMSQANRIFSADARMEEIDGFIKQLEVSSPKKWSQVDFSGQLADAKLLLEKKKKQKQQQEETERLQAEKEAKRLAEQAAKDEKLRKEQEARDAKAFAAQVEAFRKTLKVGSDTHCGPVIEIRYPMVKVAVIAQLAGFTSEAWLKVSEVYPPQIGCRNSNGRLSPNF